MPFLFHQLFPPKGESPVSLLFPPTGGKGKMNTRASFYHPPSAFISFSPLPFTSSPPWGVGGKGQGGFYPLLQVDPPPPYGGFVYP